MSVSYVITALVACWVGQVLGWIAGRVVPCAKCTTTPTSGEGE